MERIKINLPEDNALLKSLKAGDLVSLSGTVYTARDESHKRIKQALEAKEDLGFSLRGSIIYYCGPCPAPPGEVTGSAGPTTSGRMDPYTPLLLENGLLAMIGKGKRSFEVKDSIIKNEAVYFGAIGGAGALMAKCVTQKQTAAFEDLGCEAVFKLTVKDMPLVVLIDSKGCDLYEMRDKIN